MSIIIISSDSYQEGENITNKIAEQMGHSILDRRIFNGVADRYHLPEIKFAAALDKPVTTFSMPMKNRKRYLVTPQERLPIYRKPFLRSY